MAEGSKKAKKESIVKSFSGDKAKAYKGFSAIRGLLTASNISGLGGTDLNSKNSKGDKITVKGGTNEAKELAASRKYGSNGKKIASGNAAMDKAALAVIDGWKAEYLKKDFASQQKSAQGTLDAYLKAYNTGGSGGSRKATTALSMDDF